MTKTQNRWINGPYISKRVLLNTYKKFLEEPLKVFVCSELNASSTGQNVFTEKYLDTLIKLNLIKQVDAIYKTGVNYSVCRTVKGYKLK